MSRRLSTISFYLLWWSALFVGVLLTVSCGGVSKNGNSTPPQSGSSGTSGTGSSSGSGGTGDSGSNGGTSSSSGSQSSTFIFVQTSQPQTSMQVLRLNSDGTITAVSGSPFAIAANPEAVAGEYLIASTGSGIAAYKIDPGTGTPTKTSSDVNGGNVAGNSQFVYAGTTNAIYAYALANGQLQAVPGSPFNVGTVDPCGCATPYYNDLAVTQGYLFYADNADHAGASLGAGKIQSNGSFTATSFGSVPSGANLDVAPNGKFLYEASSATGNAQLFDFDPSTGTVQSEGTVEAMNPGPIDPSSTWMFATVDNSQAQGISTYQINPQSGNLTQTSLLANYTGKPIAVDPSGKYLLTFDYPTQTTYAIDVFAIDSQTGALTKVNSYSLGSYSSTYSASGFVVGKF